MKVILILLLLPACAKKLSWCDRWQVERYILKDAICPTGILDTVSVCFNSVDHNDMTGRLEKVDSVVYRMYKKKV